HGKLPWKRLLEPSIRIAREGFPIPLELYVTMKGSIARSTVDTIQSRGGIITMEDLAAYRPTIREPLIGYYQGRKIITSPEPGSGTILLFLLNVLEEYKFHEAGRTILNAQRMAEAFK
ncbi:33127_t:CDS:2, partial [Racocetra persica]